jgi:hypothetical protein
LPRTIGFVKSMPMTLVRVNIIPVDVGFGFGVVVGVGIAIDVDVWCEPVCTVCGTGVIRVLVGSRVKWERQPRKIGRSGRQVVEWQWHIRKGNPFPGV